MTNAHVSPGKELTRIDVVGESDGINVEVSTNAQVRPSLFRLTGPYRLVADFPGFRTKWRRIHVGSMPVRSVRTAVFQENPPVARVVIDLQRPVSYELESTEDKVILKLKFPRPATAASVARDTVIKQPPPTKIHQLSTAKTPLPSPEGSLPPSTLPRVELHNGLLTIQANNNSVAQVIRGIETATGATFEATNPQTESALAGPSTTQPLALNLGPGPPSAVVSEFLDLLPFSFIIIESQPGHLQKIVLTSNSGPVESAPPPPAISSQLDSPQVKGDVTPPSVSIESPAPGSVVQGIITVTAQASDDVGVVGVQFTIDGKDVGAEVTAPPYETVVDTSALLPGVHTLAASARDARGNSTISPGVSITVVAVD